MNIGETDINNATSHYQHNQTNSSVYTGNLSDSNLDDAQLVFQNNNSINNVSDFFFYGFSSNISSSILYGIIAFSSLTVIVNCAVLVAFKFATGGKSSTLVFIRSLCLADVLIGMFGIFKCVLLSNLESHLINCFLPESLFLSASTVICLTLLWLDIDSYLRLTKPFGYINNMDKHNVIIATMVLWNVAFIIGFLPQIGWNNQEFDCNFFYFYSLSYIVFISLLWWTCLFGCCFMQGVLYRARQTIEQGNNLISPRSLEYKKYKQLVATIRNDILIMSLCYGPFMIYITYFLVNERHKQTGTANINLIFFLPLFLLRSFVSAFIHSYRTIRIQRVMREISKFMNVSILNRDSDSNDTQSEQMSRVNSVNSQHHLHNRGQASAAIINVDINTATKHKKLHATASVITTLTEADENSSDGRTNAQTMF